MDQQEIITDALCDFFRGMKKNEIVVFDTETTGLIEKNKPDPFPEVLSLSAIRIKLLSKESYDILDSYSRYYFSNRKVIDPKALASNGLSQEVISKKREDRVQSGHFYPLNYEDNMSVKEFVNFCGDADHYIGYNAIDFDCHLVKGIDWTKVKVFDPMPLNASLMKIYWMESKQDWKWPRLSEAATYYGIEADKASYHSSSYDVDVTTKVFMKMLERSDIRLPNFTK